jgi:hypothetical protein
MAAILNFLEELKPDFFTKIFMYRLSEDKVANRHEQVWKFSKKKKQLQSFK